MRFTRNEVEYSMFGFERSGSVDGRDGNDTKCCDVVYDKCISVDTVHNVYQYNALAIQLCPLLQMLLQVTVPLLAPTSNTCTIGTSPDVQCRLEPDETAL